MYYKEVIYSSLSSGLHHLKNTKFSGLQCELYWRDSFSDWLSSYNFPSWAPRLCCAAVVRCKPSACTREALLYKLRSKATEAYSTTQQATWYVKYSPAARAPLHPPWKGLAYLGLSASVVGPLCRLSCCFCMWQLPAANSVSWQSLCIHELKWSAVAKEDSSFSSTELETSAATTIFSVQSFACLSCPHHVNGKAVWTTHT